MALMTTRRAVATYASRADLDILRLPGGMSAEQERRLVRRCVEAARRDGYLVVDRRSNRKRSKR